MPRKHIAVKKGTPSKLIQLAGLVDAVMRPEAPAGFRMADEFPHMFCAGNASNLYYVEEEGRPASLAGVVKCNCILNSATVSGASIGSVATLPEYRGRHFATSILNEIFEDLERGDTALVLISGIRGLYKRLDCAETGREFMVSLNERDLANIRAGIEFDVEFVPPGKRQGEAAALHEIYVSETHRYFRKPEFMEMIFDGLWFRRNDWDMRLFEMLHGGRIFSYAVCYMDRKRRGSVSIMEWAGSRIALLSGLKDILASYGAATVEFSFLPDDVNMLSLLEGFGVKYVPRNIQGTVRPMNVPLLIEELQPCFNEHLGGEVKLEINGKDDWTFTGPFGTRRMTGRAALADWIFGTGKGSLGIQLMRTDDLNYI